jgi:predicted esterase
MRLPIIITSLFILSNVHAQRGFKLDSVNSVAAKNYFSARLTNYAIEDFLPDAPISQKLSKEDTNAAAGHVWNLWRWVNNKIDTLPEPTSVIDGQKPFVHQWELLNEDPMPYLFVRKGSDTSRKPLFLNLHGSGPKEKEFEATLAWSLRYRDAPSLYIIPQIPNERRYRWWLQPTQLTWEKLFRMAMLTPEVDPNRIYILGISEGGYGSQRLGAFYADYLAGVGPMAGGEPLNNAPPLNYRHVAFSFQTGEKDTGFGRNTLTALAKAKFDSLEKAFPGDYVHQIQLQLGRGHGIDYTLTTPWLKSYKRRGNPTNISWVWFPMDNRYRKGFYNISINKSPIDTINGVFFDRAEFRIDIDRKTNTIIMNAELLTPKMTERAKIKKGEISIYLDDDLINLDKKVTIIYNGKKVYRRRVSRSLSALVESCALFGDPNRLYSAKVQIAL